MNNIITAQLKKGVETRTIPIWQYDYGMVLLPVGVDLPDAYEVHFANDKRGNSVTSIGNANGADIPDSLLLSGKNIYAWVYLHSGEDDGETVYNVYIPVNDRAHPTNATPTPVQQDVITQTIAALNAAVEKSDSNVLKYPKIVDGYWYCWDANQNTFVNTMVAATGEKGDKGDPGFSPTATVVKSGDTATITITDKNGTTTAEVTDGEDGISPVANVSKSGKKATITITDRTGTTEVEITDGEDGFSPSAAVSKSGDTAEISITDKNGTTTTQIKDGFAPTASVSKVGHTATITITDKNGTTSKQVSDGDTGATPVIGIGTVSKLQPGSNPTATMDVTDPEHPVLSMGLVTGDPGEVSQAQLDAVETELKSHFNACFDTETFSPNNLFDFDAVTFGHYMTNTGAVAENASYWYSGFIPVEEGVEYSFQRGNKTVVQGRDLLWIRWISCYDANKDIISNEGVSNWAQTYTIPVGVSYIILSSSELISPKNDKNPAMVKGTTIVDYEEYFSPYTERILKAENNNDPHIQSIVNQTLARESGKLIFTATSGALSANTDLICCNYSNNKKNEYIEVTAHFSTFGELTVSHGKGYYSGGYITITGTKIQIYTDNATLVEEFEHGLTLSDFINVIINTKNDHNNRSSITIMTAGGDYTAETTRYYGIRSAVLCNATFAMTNVEMRYVVNDAKEDVWVFGDSYISLGDPNRWATQLVSSGHKHLLLNGFGGAMSEYVYPVVEYFADIVTPKYIVWCLGMNDADSGAINSSWKTCVDDLLTYCEAKGITPILATIPNCPNIDNTYKNAYIKSLNVRYVDFAKAVNAENAEATWYTGMLSNDNTHPTALGAKALMRQFLIDVPEVLYAED